MKEPQTAVERREPEIEPMHTSFETPPIGGYLRRQRVLRGMTTEELARLTRIPLRSIERLENGQFDGVTDGFVRGFVRTVAEALGLDTEDTISRMLQEPASSAAEARDAGRSFKQGLAGLAAVLLLSLAFLGLRAVWDAARGEVGGEGSREAVVWRDPVRTLAEATGARSGALVDRDRSSAAEASDADESAARVP